MTIETWIKDVPEGVETASHEGHDIRSAVLGAAQQLGVDPDEVVFTIDLGHFDNGGGRRVPRDTIRVVVWQDTSLVDSPVKEAKAWLGELLENMGIAGTIGGNVNGNCAGRCRGKAVLRPKKENPGELGRYLDKKSIPTQ